MLAKIFLPPKIPKSKISNPQTPSIIPVTCNPETQQGDYSTLVTEPVLNNCFSIIIQLITRELSLAH